MCSINKVFNSTFYCGDNIYFHGLQKKNKINQAMAGFILGG